MSGDFQKVSGIPDQTSSQVGWLRRQLVELVARLRDTYRGLGVSHWYRNREAGFAEVGRDGDAGYWTGGFRSDYHLDKLRWRLRRAVKKMEKRLREELAFQARMEMKRRFSVGFDEAQDRSDEFWETFGKSWS